jgi:hypothetical protein
MRTASASAGDALARFRNQMKKQPSTYCRYTEPALDNSFFLSAGRSSPIWMPDASLSRCTLGSQLIFFDHISVIFDIPHSLVDAADFAQGDLLFHPSV